MILCSGIIPHSLLLLPLQLCNQLIYKRCHSIYHNQKNHRVVGSGTLAANACSKCPTQFFHTYSYHLFAARASASFLPTMRQLKYHEKKLLKKVDFLKWKNEDNLRELQVREWHNRNHFGRCPTGRKLYLSQGHAHACTASTSHKCIERNLSSFHTDAPPGHASVPHPGPG